MFSLKSFYIYIRTAIITIFLRTEVYSMGRYYYEVFRSPLWNPRGSTINFTYFVSVVLGKSGKYRVSWKELGISYFTSRIKVSGLLIAPILFVTSLGHFKRVRVHQTTKTSWSCVCVSVCLTSEIGLGFIFKDLSQNFNIKI